MQEERPGLLKVVRAQGTRRAVAARSVGAGAVLAHLDGEVVSRPSRHSVQIGPDAHLDGAMDDAGAEGSLRRPWRYLNHSCDPNAAVRGRTLVALRPIAAGEDVVFDYDTTEFELADPFVCGCASPECRRAIRGYKHLGPALRARLAPLTAPYLPAMLEVRAAGAAP